MSRDTRAHILSGLDGVLATPADVQVDEHIGRMNGLAARKLHAEVIGCARKALPLLGLRPVDQLCGESRERLLEMVGPQGSGRTKQVLVLLANALEQRETSPHPDQAIKLKSLALGLDPGDKELRLSLARSYAAYLRDWQNIPGSAMLLYRARQTANAALKDHGISAGALTSRNIPYTDDTRDAVERTIKAAAIIYCLSGEASKAAKRDSADGQLQMSVNLALGAVRLFGLQSGVNRLQAEALGWDQLSAKRVEDPVRVGALILVAARAYELLGDMEHRDRLLATAASIAKPASAVLGGNGKNGGHPANGTASAVQLGHGGTSGNGHGRSQVPPAPIIPRGLDWDRERRPILDTTRLDEQLNRLAHGSRFTDAFNRSAVDLLADIGTLVASRTNGHFNDNYTALCIDHLGRRIDRLWEKASDPAGIVVISFIGRELDIIARFASPAVGESAMRLSREELTGLSETLEGLCPRQRESFLTEVSRVNEAAQLAAARLGLSQP